MTGGAGFIGSHLVDRLVDEGWEVNVVDSLDSGHFEFIEHHMEKKGFRFFKGDLNDRGILGEALEGCEYVFHLAADPVIRGGFTDEDRRNSPIRNNILGTCALLESMNDSGVKRIVFSSSSVVYGEAKVVPTPESYGPLVPISLYGASKLAGEALIMAYSHGLGYEYWIFRFANVVGPRMGQGVAHDFVSKLKRDPQRLEILGDGKQSKSYLHVMDCVGAMLYCVERSKNEIFNLGTPTPISVDDVAEIVEKEMELGEVCHEYTGGYSGWKGDLPRTFLSIEKLADLGWNPSMDSNDAVRSAVEDLLG